MMLCAGAGAAPGDSRALDLVQMRETIERLGLRYQVSENWVTRLSAEERRRVMGGCLTEDPDRWPRWQSLVAVAPPDSFDWRNLKGQSYVSNVRNQGVCGSCWDFAAVALMEATMMIALDQPDTDPDLSEQRILSCNDNGDGCGGGFMETALEFMRIAGTPPEPCFPYYGDDAVPCLFGCHETIEQVQKLESWSVVTGGEINVELIKTALTFGPVGACFEVFESFSAYSGGIYSAYGSVTTDEGHCVIIVGYNDVEQYWIAKNSWGLFWGEDGYFRIAYDNGCGFGAFTVVCTYQPGWTEPVSWEPHDLSAGEELTVRYDPGGRSLEGTGMVTLHWGHSAWQEVSDQQMTWNGGKGSWEATITVPAIASSVQFAFVDQLDLWDNNAGADWSLAVNSATFILDGFIDGGVPLLASGSGLSLWGAVNGDFLYLATEGTALTFGQDRFLLVTANPDQTGVAPWAKAGQVLAWNYYLGAEESNLWSGWFDAVEVHQIGPGFAKAHGGVLEGVLDLEALYSGSPPDTLWIAAAGYETSEGGALFSQSPAGDGDGDLEAGEYHAIATTVLGTYLSNFRAYRDDGVAIVRWEMNSAAQVGSFCVWRAAQGSERTMISPEIPSGSLTYEYRDEEAPAGAVEYWLQELRAYGYGIWHGPTRLEAAAQSPVALQLYQNHPNPFNPVTTISFELREASEVTLAVYGVDGRRIATLAQRVLPRGPHTVSWDGCDPAGQKAASGVYYCVLETVNSRVTKKMMLLK
jgi:C1A family cysteine protease